MHDAALALLLDDHSTDGAPTISNPTPVTARPASIVAAPMEWYRAHIALMHRLARCMAVSIGCTLLSQTILITLAVGFNMRAGVANAIAVVCGTVPSYFGNRRWVWGRDGRGSVSREVIPFWALSIGGLIISTVLVGRVGAMTVDWSGFTRSVVLAATNIGVFGVLWIVQFVLLDRYVFRVPDVVATVTDVDLDDDGGEGPSATVTQLETRASLDARAPLEATAVVDGNAVVFDIPSVEQP